MTVVFYDLENIFLGMHYKKRRYFRLADIVELIEGSAETGEIWEQRAYCTWSRPNMMPFQDQLRELGVVPVETKRPVYHYRKRKVIKNFADLFVFMDALDYAYTRPEVDCFVFVSRDSDFAILSERLHAMGKKALQFEHGYRLPPALFEPKVPVIVKPNVQKHLGEMICKRAAHYKGMRDFDTMLGKVLEHCGRDEQFEEAVHETGLNIATIYAQMKNGNMHVTYKSSGQKKMPLAFAQALEDSEYCVCERDKQFFVIAREAVPEDVRVVELPSEEELAAEAAAREAARIAKEAARKEAAAVDEAAAEEREEDDEDAVTDPAADLGWW